MRYAVIFIAKINELDKGYSAVAAQLRDLAINEYGCTGFSSVTDGSIEIAISYWLDQEHIKRWKQDAEHMVAQELGRSKWYDSYQVQVVEIIHEYCKDS